MLLRSPRLLTSYCFLCLYAYPASFVHEFLFMCYSCVLHVLFWCCILSLLCSASCLFLRPSQFVFRLFFPSVVAWLMSLVLSFGVFCCVHLVSSTIGMSMAYLLQVCDVFAHSWWPRLSYWIEISTAHLLPDDKTKYYSNGIRASIQAGGGEEQKKKVQQLLEREFLLLILSCFPVDGVGPCPAQKLDVAITHEQLRILKENPPNKAIEALQRRRTKTPMCTTRQEKNR